MRAADARVLLLEGAAELGLDLGGGRAEALLRLTGLVVAWGRRINLTGHRDEAAVVRGLVLEAGALLVHAPEFSSLADLGSGAGFPGLPIAVLRPEVEVTLVESRLRRHHFQRAAVRELGLTNVRPVRGRAETLPARPHQAVVAQAMARPSRALAWMLPWAAAGGWLLLPGGERPPEIAAAPGFRFECLVRYRLPGDGPGRTLWIARRIPGGG